MADPIKNLRVRAPHDLKERLSDAAVQGRRSLNREVVERLERSLDPDSSLQIAEILRPALSHLSDTEQAEIVALTARMVTILLGSKRRFK